MPCTRLWAFNIDQPQSQAPGCKIMLRAIVPVYHRRRAKVVTYRLSCTQGDHTSAHKSARAVNAVHAQRRWRPACMRCQRKRRSASTTTCKAIAPIWTCRTPWWTRMPQRTPTCFASRLHGVPRHRATQLHRRVLHALSTCLAQPDLSIRKAQLTSSCTHIRLSGRD